MTVGGSQQLRIFRRAIRDGDTLIDAAIAAGMSMHEARAWANDDRKNPPPPEAFTLLNTAGTSPAKPEEDEMGRPRKKEGIINGEVPKPDFDEADTIYINDIAPANKAQKQAMKDAGDGWKAVKGVRVHVGGYRKAMQVAGMEEAEQQAWLRSFNGGLQKRGVSLVADLVDQAQTGAQAGASAVPITTERPKPTLVTINHPADDSDLNPPDPEPELTATNGEIVDHDPLGLGLNDAGGDEEHQQAAE